MFYDFPITVPADTQEGDPVIEEMKLAAGVINWIEIRYKYGPSFMVYVRLLQGGHQLWPTNPESAFRDDGRAIAFAENFPLTPDNNILKAVCYSPGTVYDHEIIVRLGILPEEVVTPLSGVVGALQKFLALVGIKG